MTNGCDLPDADRQLAARSLIDGRTHLRLTLSHTSVGSGDCWIVATSGQRVTPRSARKASITPSSSARHGPRPTGAAAPRANLGSSIAITARGIVAAAGRGAAD